MLKRLRKKYFNRNLRNFLERYLPEIGLGELKSIVDLGDKYSLGTSIGEYIMELREDLGSIKLFYMGLSKNGSKRYEGILIQIWGRLHYKIIPVEIVIDNNNERQITNLITLETAIYVIDEKTRENGEVIRRSRRPFYEAESVKIAKLVEISNRKSRR